MKRIYLTDAVDVVSANTNDWGDGFEDYKTVRWSHPLQTRQITHHIDHYRVNLVLIETDWNDKCLGRRHCPFCDLGLGDGEQRETDKYEKR